MENEMEKAIGKWFTNRIVETSTSSYGVSLVTIEPAPAVRIHLMIDPENNIVGSCETF